MFLRARVYINICVSVYVLEGRTRMIYYFRYIYRCSGGDGGVCYMRFCAGCIVNKFNNTY